MSTHDRPNVPVAGEGAVRAVRAVRDRITAGYYLPGARLTLRELTTSTRHECAELRPALAHLADALGAPAAGRYRPAPPSCASTLPSSPSRGLPTDSSR
ncbi:hypothetical protein [Streptomyces microflavus]|uniref:hypothetical protein n=1 Tax=Streptomyces microflavus TaxID=1919 RepID=UPI0038135841